MQKLSKANGLFLLCLVANKSENHWRKYTLYPAKTQNGSPRITDLSKMLMSAFILKCHKMLLMSHFYKTVMNIAYYYHQGSSSRHTDQASRYCGN